MGKIKAMHDTVGRTLTVQLDETAKEHVCGETADKVILMPDRHGEVIDVEMLQYQPIGKAKDRAIYAGA